MKNFPVKLSEGKYKFYTGDPDGSLYCDRYGEPWRDFIGDHAVSLLYERLIEVEQERDIQLNAMQDMAEELIKIDHNPYSASEDWEDMSKEAIVEHFMHKNREKNV